MAVTIPTLEELTDQILQDIATEFGVDVSELGTTYIVAAKVQAGIIYQQYLALSGVQKNIFYDLADLLFNCRLLCLQTGNLHFKVLLFPD